MNESSRFWLASILAPLSVPIFLSLGQLIAGSGDFIEAGIWLAAAFSYLGFIFLGLPCVLFLKANGRLSFVAMLIAGVIAGALYGVIFEAVFGGPDIRMSYRGMGIPIFLSVMVATVFGVIAKERLS